MIVSISAIIFTVLTGIAILFHLCLVIGMPWGEATMGGKYPGKLPKRMRVISVFSMIILFILAIIVLAKADLAIPAFKSISNAAIWFVVGFSAIGTILNTITPSKIERNIWAPITALLLITSIIVALG